MSPKPDTPPGQDPDFTPPGQNPEGPPGQVRPDQELPDHDQPEIENDLPEGGDEEEATPKQ